MWDLVRGAAPLQQPTPVELARRYTELLADNLGQPGFRELLSWRTTSTRSRDLVFALRRRVAAARSGPAATTEAAEERRAEVLDLARRRRAST